GPSKTLTSTPSLAATRARYWSAMARTWSIDIALAYQEPAGEQQRDRHRPAAAGRARGPQELVGHPLPGDVAAGGREVDLIARPVRASDQVARARRQIDEAVSAEDAAHHPADLGLAR